MTMSQEHIDTVYLELVRRDPAADSEQGRALSRLWAQQLSDVLDQVFETSRNSGRIAWHIDARAEAIFETARLMLWLRERILDHRLNGRAVADIDIGEKQAALKSPEAIERVQNTASMVVEHIWNPIYDQLQKKYPLVRSPKANSAAPRLPGSTPRHRQPGTKDNHFVPKFTVHPWADADGKVRELRRLPNGRIQSRPRPYARWGFEHFLYSQELEDYFQQVESRAAGPYRQVLQYLPLTPDDRYFWISFLILQHLRTPAFMAKLATGLRQKIKVNRWDYPTTPEAMRRAYLTLFQEDKVFSAYYRQIDQRRWYLLAPSAGMSFPRTDVPFVIDGGANNQGWRCVYPLTPERCFQAGPDRVGKNDVPFALSTLLSRDETLALNRLLLNHTKRSLAIRTTDDLGEWTEAFADALGGIGNEYRAWGPLGLLS